MLTGCVAAATANNHRCWYLWHVRRYDGSHLGQTTIPDPDRTWCYRRGGSAYPKRGSGIARGLGLRSFLSTTFVADTRRFAASAQAASRAPRAATTPPRRRAA